MSAQPGGKGSGCWMARFAVLNRNGDFRALYHRGKSQVHPALVTYARKSRTGFSRAGITTGKKVGCAVQRNRCRRIIREAYRALLPRIEGGWDLVFVARARTGEFKSTKLQKIMETQLKALGVIPSSKVSHVAEGKKSETMKR